MNHLSRLIGLRHTLRRFQVSPLAHNTVRESLPYMFYFVVRKVTPGLSLSSL